ncbi:endonuclease domain-containing protein [Mucilaginibacter sp. OK283]|jgi:very-short-patch-repair endonuclease|uniref:endonuclease domain-containing protein n=1 Tax=Mucilaginibacter sp. OK283 TaxID=1881049 RepID=UPI0008AF9604|nr:endonuclease domain-containing protein [Mucilaginibacter sp. OK283]SEP20729.1 Very-short-patch-repair endonuclease [Mucilaginibacter sp. OK283]
MANRKIIPYNPALKALARKLRKTMTDGELLLWNELKHDKLLGFDFDRQRFIDEYIVDFYCRDLMLTIEIDGMSNNNEVAFVKDQIRQQKLENFGITFLRFTEAEMKNDMFNVLRTIETTVIEIIKNDSTIKLPKDFDLELLTT